MEILITALLMFWGNATEQHPDLTLEAAIQASLESKQAIVEQSQEPPKEDQHTGTSEWVKIDPQAGEVPVIRGLYATGYTAGGSLKLPPILKLIDETALNALVIDVKEDKGHITYKTENPELQKLGDPLNMISDMEQLFNTLDEHEIYPIARIVVFKDTILANKRPDLSFLNADGTVWHNNKASGPEAFVNPYKKEVWDYNIEVAKEAAKLGFKEIQFDYVRFPEGFETRADKLQYETNELSRTEIITEFVKYAREQLNPLGVRVSVDVFGYAASTSADGIGQDFNDISKYVDVVSPMVYPSHYSTGWFGSPVPDAEPYITINGAMVDTNESLQELGELKPIVRPWIQDFSATTWIKGAIPYGKAEVEAQIQALLDNGIEEFLLWNSSNVYTPNVDYTLENENN